MYTLFVKTFPLVLRLRSSVNAHYMGISVSQIPVHILEPAC